MYNLLFTTSNGIAVPAVTAEQMREVDRIAIEETGPNLFQMMENAGRSLVLQAIDMLGDDWRQKRILIMAGTGGNGGGGICAARHLINRGANVGLILTDTPKPNTARCGRNTSIRLPADSLSDRMNWSLRNRV